MAIAICKLCNKEFEFEQKKAYGNKQKYCYACKEELRLHDSMGERRVRVKEDNPIIKRDNSSSSYIVKHNDCYLAGLYVGKQGYLREKYLELRALGMMDIEIYHQIKNDDKWLAEMKGLSLEQKCAWILGFYNCIGR